MVTKEEKRKIGKKSRKFGRDFELKVRKDLESKGWVVSKWMNQVEFAERIGTKDDMKNADEYPSMKMMSGKLIPAKHKFCGFGRPLVLGTGFPDFLCFRNHETNIGLIQEVIGVECKTHGKLDKIEKEKVKWLLDNNIFSKILIAKKGKNKGEIIYEEFR